ncbi:hypothetical protein SAMN04488144_14518 [Methylobacterium sp. 190mf]|nr:hypothetical protein SAMN04488144_14518 [Methylobacterium sp. 190mf]
MRRARRRPGTDDEDTLPIAARSLDTAHLQHSERWVDEAIEGLLHPFREFDDPGNYHRVWAAGALWMVICLIDTDDDSTSVGVG